MSKDILFDNKISFVVALFVALISLSFYSDFLKTIPLEIGLKSISTSLFFPLIVAIVLLFISIYFYGLYYLKDDFPIFLNYSKYFKLLGNFFYLLTLISIPYFIILALLTQILKLIAIPVANFILSLPLNNELKLIISVIPLLLGITILIISLESAIIATKRQKERILNTLKEQEEKMFEESEKLYNLKLYGPAIMGIFMRLEITINRKILEDKGVELSNFPISKTLEFGRKNHLLTNEQVAIINEIKAIRNNVARNPVKIDKKTAENVLAKSRIILEELNKKSDNINGSK